NQRRAHRAFAVGILCLLAFAAGLVVGALHKPAGQASAETFASAWTRGDYAAMYSQLTAADRKTYSRRGFTRSYTQAMQTATARSVRVGRPRHRGDAYVLPVAVATRIFGTVRGQVTLPVDDHGVDWSTPLVFPGLRNGERLRRNTSLPPRAALLARDKTVLAQGPSRVSAVPAVSAQVVGALGPVPPERAAEL